MLKRSYFKIKPRKPMKRSGFKQKITTPMKRTKIRVVGHSTTAELKNDIQAILRLIAIKRDKVCVLSHHSEAGNCGSERNKNGEPILQAEHLNSRSNTGTFGDMRNIVLLCKYHHMFWKKKNSALYWELIKKEIGKERYTWYQRARDDHRAYKVDLRLILIGLKQELNQYDQT